ncbi:MAG: FMN-binding protein [Thermoanaerobaculia bacterium]
MKRRAPLALLAPAALVVAGPVPAWAAVYLSVDEARELLFPGKQAEEASLHLPDETVKAIEKASGMRVRSRELRAWRIEGGGTLLVDEVLGKHEFIPYAVGIDAGGAVVGVEILEYRETYGDEIRNESWRRQFAGRTAGAPLALGSEVKNISGATLSCRHVTDGVRRLLATWELVFRGR